MTEACVNKLMLINIRLFFINQYVREGFINTLDNGVKFEVNDATVRAALSTPIRRAVP